MTAPDIEGRDITPGRVRGVALYLSDADADLLDKVLGPPNMNLSRDEKAQADALRHFVRRQRESQRTHVPVFGTSRYAAHNRRHDD
jgi:hypothetical protein